MAHRMTRAIPLALLVLAACASENRRDEASEGLRRYGLNTYLEEGNLVALMVSSRPAIFRLDRAYIPLEIAVVNKGLPALTVRRESLVLKDAQGRRYPVVSAQELSRGYGNTDVDRRLGELAPFVAGRFQTYQQIASNLTPGHVNGVLIDPVNVPRQGFMVDYVYFAQPQGGAGGQRLELFLRTPELPDPVFVKFAVPKGRAGRAPAAAEDSR